jgi:ribosome-associated protein
MLEINAAIRIPDSELEWTFVRSSGPGGQNVNKVASKAVLRWHLAASASLPDEVKTRLCRLQQKRITNEGDLVLTSQRYRDQGSNVADCLEKLRGYVLQATLVPKVRRPSRPTRGSREARLKEKRHRSTAKGRRRPSLDD